MKYLQILFYSFFSVVLVFSNNIEESDNEIKIVVLAYLEENSENAKSFIDIVENYNLDNPEVEVVWELLSEDTYFNTLSTALEGQEQLDIVFVKNNKKYLDLLTISGENIDQKQFIDSSLFEDAALRAYNATGQLITVPYGKYADTVMYVNEDLLRIIGLNPAKTYEELLNQKETVLEYNRLLLSNPISWSLENGVLLYSLLLARFGGPEYIDRLVSGMSKFTKEPSLMALNTIKMFSDDLKFDGLLLDTDVKNSLELFNSGMSLYMLDELWREEFITIPNYKMINFVSIPEELFPGSVNGGYYYGYSILKSAVVDHVKRDYVIKLFNRLYGNKASDLRAKNQGIVSVLKVKSSDFDIRDKNRSKYIQSLSSVTPTITDYLSASVIQVINTGIIDLFDDKVTPEELSEKIQNAYQNE